jgi:hypothetical protein
MIRANPQRGPEERAIESFPRGGSATRMNLRGSRNAALARGLGGVWTTSCLELLSDLVRPFACGVLGRIDLLVSFATKDANEAHGVRLLAGGLDDLGKGGTLGALHLGDYLGLLVGAVGLGFARFIYGSGSTENSDLFGNQHLNKLATTLPNSLVGRAVGLLKPGDTAAVP